MPISTRYLFTASMDVDPDKEALFDEVYDQEHVPNLLKVPGVISVSRLTLEPLTLGIGGEKRPIVIEGEPKHSAIYEIESPEVPGQPGMGRGGRGRALARSGPPLHQQPPPHPAQSHKINAVTGRGS